ncbi:MAG: STAS domain-containing protein [Chromatiaceae bacterium]
MDEVLRLPESLTIGDVAALHLRLLGLLKTHSDLAVDGLGVGILDTAGAQLLAVLWRDAADRGVSIHWVGVSRELTATARALGLDTLLGLAPGQWPADDPAGLPNERQP